MTTSEVHPTVSAKYMRKWARIPKQQATPISYLFQAPNFARVDWGNTQTPPPGAYVIADDYAVIAINTCPPLSAAHMRAISGYYDKPYTISGYAGSPATTLTVAGNNFAEGDRLIYQRSVPGAFFFFDVSSVSGSAVNGISTQVADESSTADFFDYFVDVVTPLNVCRRMTRNDTDTGQSVYLTAEQVQDFYLPGVSVGISSASSIPKQQPYSLARYLAAWAKPQSWFTVQSSGITQWLGSILKSEYIRCKISDLA